MDVVQNYKCPCCTAPLVFDAETQNLICESCDNTFPLETMQQMAEGDENSGCFQNMIGKAIRQEIMRTQMKLT